MEKEKLNSIHKVEWEKFRRDQFDKNYERSASSITNYDKYGICPCCGKKVAITPKTKMIHMFEGGRYVTDEDWEGSEEDSGDMGWFYIGADCYRRFRKMINA